eukprot:TRINITY_DN98272_c0_g1_i1.p1 TRINITY_DN98272_c0_g1~~TRINITY_DN98272_c0_g1_i1.p1  ORF type:complete len:280 (+),score=133.22 TRINITY_DN98272_c0_g1_i1:59-898(+)
MTTKRHRLEGLSAIVTGAANGIGLAIARTFVLHGASVMLADIEDESGRAAVQSIVAAVHTAGAEDEQKDDKKDAQSVAKRVCFHHTDVSDEQQVEACVAATVQAFGGLDIVVNNAAAFVYGGVAKVGAADMLKAYSVNVIGQAMMVKYALPHLRQSEAAAVVNIGSVSSFIAQPQFVPYNSSKAGVLQLTRCLAMDLASDGVRVNAVCPGAIKTRATDNHIKKMGMDKEQAYVQFGNDAVLRRMGRPDEIASAVLFLASSDASFITGTHLVVDGGATID